MADQDIDPGKLKITTTQAIKYGLAILTFVGGFYKIQTDIALLKSDVYRNTVEIANNKRDNKQEFKEVHAELKAVMKEMSVNKDEILEKIDQKHSQ